MTEQTHVTEEALREFRDNPEIILAASPSMISLIARLALRGLYQESFEVMYQAAKTELALLRLSAREQRALESTYRTAVEAATNNGRIPPPLDVEYDLSRAREVIERLGRASARAATDSAVRDRVEVLQRELSDAELERDLIRAQLHDARAALARQGQ